ncbi:hypothetical protein ACFL2T_06410 [Elusimicrobiota bacterium]
MRRFLFLLFTDDSCRRNHAFAYAVDLKKRGHEVRIIIEGISTRSFKELADKESRFTRLFEEAKSLDLIYGACKTAATGCGGDKAGGVMDAVKAEGVALLDDLDGHAGISSLIEEGYQVLVF